MKPFQQDIKVFPTDDWVVQASHEISKKINDYLKEKKRCSLMLTGGETTKKLYQYWSSRRACLWDYHAVDYFFGDERCVAPDHIESNYRLALENFFSKVGVNKEKIHRIYAERDNKQQAVEEYADTLPNEIDVLLLSLGLDGHIASLFPHSTILNEYDGRVAHVIGTKYPENRITISPDVIVSAKNVFLLAVGGEKGGVLSDACKEPTVISEMPVRLLMKQNCVWLLDDLAANTLGDVSG
jgi:6-phosphogluconolactonase